MRTHSLSLVDVTVAHGVAEVLSGDEPTNDLDFDGLERLERFGETRRVEL